MAARVAMIIPYFGKFPEWMDLYLWSCSKNKMVDFFYISDAEIPAIKYDNTFFIQMEYDRYCQLVSERLNISFHPTSPYKLCDLKPFLAVVHRELIQAYDFWGYGDLDVVYGDLTLIINEENLARYELITTSIAYIVGHFTIIKRNSIYETMATQIPNWQNKLEDEKHYAMDEIDFNYCARPNYKLIDLLWLNGCSRIFENRTRFYKQMLRLFRDKNRVLMEDWSTTFTPIENVIYRFDLSSLKFYIPGMVCPKRLKINRWIYLPYLHFYEFKHSLKDIKHPTWVGDFYQIPKDHVFTDTDIVEITTQYIRLSTRKSRVK